MKKKFTLLFLYAFMSHMAIAQFTIDGNMNEAGYTTTILKANTNACFGLNIDIKAIKIGKDANNLYIGIVGKLPTSGNADAIALWLNFNGVTGAVAGTNLYTPVSGTTPRNYMNYNFKADFEVDYMFLIYSGNANGNNAATATLCNVSAGRKVGTSITGPMDECGQDGLAITNVRGTGNIFGIPGVDFAFKNTASSTTTGIEFMIPYTAVGLTAATAATVQAFATVVSNTGYYSNLTIPGTATQTFNTTTLCLGQDGLGQFDQASPTHDTYTIDFNTIAGGAFHTNAIAIPVELVNFHAKIAKNNVELDWSTATERDNAYFEIERSANGKEWKTIGKVLGNGNSSRKNMYNFTDDTPLSKINYYRLKQVDFNEKVNYSPIISVNLQANGVPITVFPNPTHQYLTVVSDHFDTENNSANIYDISGKLVQSSLFEGVNIDVSRLAQGIYHLRISDKNAAIIHQTRFVKQ